MSLPSRLDIPRLYREWRYRRLSESVSTPVTDQAVLATEGYFSQCGQDKWLVETMFPGVRKGTFVDIGAHDGVSFSNTLFLERHLGWTGIAIEPIPEVFERLSQSRSCIKVNGCIAADSKDAVFRKIHGYSEMLSGLVTQYDPRHLDRINREIVAHGGRIEEIVVPCFELNALLAKHGLRDVHYLSLDVEGAELAILESFDFSAANVLVWGIENNYRDYRIPMLMKQHGYRMIAVVGDELYVKDGAQRVLVQ